MPWPSESSQVFLAQLDKTLGKDIVMAIMKGIKVIVLGPNPFSLDKEEEDDPLTVTTTQQDLVDKHSIQGTPTSAKNMRTKGPVDINVFQDVTVGTFAADMEHNLEEVICMFRSLEVEHRITETVGDTAQKGILQSGQPSEESVTWTANMEKFLVVCRNRLGAWVGCTICGQ